MKPENWSRLPRTEKLKLGTELFCSQHGKYLISLALTYAIEALKHSSPELRQNEHLGELEMLRETLFDQFSP